MDAMPALARTVDVYRAAIQRRIQLIDGKDAFDELRLAGSHRHTEVVKELEGDGTAKRNAVFDIAGKLRIAAHGNDAEGGNWDGDVTERGVGGITRYRRAIRVGEDELGALRNKRIGGAGADVEAAKLCLAALIKALEGRRDLAAETLNVLCLEADAEDVPSLFARLQAMHAVEVAVFEDRIEVLDVPADASHLQQGGVFHTFMRIVGIADLVVGVRQRNLAGINALKRVVSLDTTAEGERLEKRGGCRTKCGDRALLEGIGEADA